MLLHVVSIEMRPAQPTYFLPKYSSAFQLFYAFMYAIGCTQTYNSSAYFFLKRPEIPQQLLSTQVRLIRLGRSMFGHIAFLK